MSKLVILFVCLAVFEIASALKCYKCDNCQGSPSSWDKVECGGVQPPANSEWACTQIFFKDKKTYKESVERKCVVAEKQGKNLIFHCPTVNGEPSKCPVCQDDLCNSAPNLKFSFVALGSVLVALLAHKFF